MVEDWAPSGKYNSRSRVPTLSCLSAAFLLSPPVGDLGLEEGFDFSSGCSCSESLLCCPLLERGLICQRRRKCQSFIFSAYFHKGMLYKG